MDDEAFTGTTITTCGCGRIHPEFLCEFIANSDSAEVKALKVAYFDLRQSAGQLLSVEQENWPDYVRKTFAEVRSRITKGFSNVL